MKASHPQETLSGIFNDLSFGLTRDKRAQAPEVIDLTQEERDLADRAFALGANASRDPAGFPGLTRPPPPARQPNLESQAGRERASSGQDASLFDSQRRDGTKTAKKAVGSLRHPDPDLPPDQDRVGKRLLSDSQDSLSPGSLEDGRTDSQKETKPTKAFFAAKVPDQSQPPTVSPVCPSLLQPSSPFSHLDHSPRLAAPKPDAPATAPEPHRPPLLVPKVQRINVFDHRRGRFFPTEQFCNVFDLNSALNPKGAFDFFFGPKLQQPDPEDPNLSGDVDAFSFSFQKKKPEPASHSKQAALSIDSSAFKLNPSLARDLLSTRMNAFSLNPMVALDHLESQRKSFREQTSEDSKGSSVSCPSPTPNPKPNLEKKPRPSQDSKDADTHLHPAPRQRQIKKRVTTPDTKKPAAALDLTTQPLASELTLNSANRSTASRLPRASDRSTSPRPDQLLIHVTFGKLSKTLVAQPDHSVGQLLRHFSKACITGFTRPIEDRYFFYDPCSKKLLFLFDHTREITGKRLLIFDRDHPVFFVKSDHAEVRLYHSSEPFDVYPFKIKIAPLMVQIDLQECFCSVEMQHYDRPAALLQKRLSKAGAKEISIHRQTLTFLYFV